jgi:hypothetical protein
MKPDIQDSSGHFTGRIKRVFIFYMWKLSLSWNVRWYILHTKDILAFKPAIPDSGQFTGRKKRSVKPRDGSPSIEQSFEETFHLEIERWFDRSTGEV